jgi:hypothetical protein
MYKKMIQNLEFIADSEALKKISDKRIKLPFKITTQDIVLHLLIPLSIINQKTNRYVNKNQSTKNAWKYTAILPALVGFTFTKLR